MNNKERELAMFGCTTQEIDDVVHAFNHPGRPQTVAMSIMSDAQELLQRLNTTNSVEKEMIRHWLNRAKYIISEHCTPDR